jgi:LacI family transcriptional regulator
LFRRIQERNVPYVLVDRPIPGLHASFVGADNLAIGRLATEHLVKRGCCRIAHLRGPAIGIARDRFEGYRRALAKHGWPANMRYVVAAGHEDETGYEGMRRLLEVRPIPDGVFCFNDPVAIGAIKAIREAGLRVPQDIAVVGAGNVHYSDLLAVPLTTVDQGTRQMGTHAAEILLERIGQTRSLRPRKILIPPKLVERESTRRMP